MSEFSSIIHLLGRHPELFENQEFLAWSARYGAEVWHETHLSKQGLITIVVQSLDRLHLFAALLRLKENDPLSAGPIAEVANVAQFDLLVEKFSSHSAAFALIAERKVSSQQLQAIRPVVNFDVGPPQLTWEIELLRDHHLETFRASKESGIESIEQRLIDAFDRADEPLLVHSTADDSLASNDLHHPAQFLEQALAWTTGAATVTEKARRIWQRVRVNYAYDATITNIREFTFADVLVEGPLGRKGICDEFAVMMVSHLRALEIPAVIKFVKFQIIKPVAHACTEFQNEEGRWVHADPVYGAFDLPSVYRKRTLAKNVLVIDASFPSDERSHEPSLGLPDVAGDQQLNPYTDFLLNPSSVGEPRPGYSF